MRRAPARPSRRPDSRFAHPCRLRRGGCRRDALRRRRHRHGAVGKRAGSLLRRGDPQSAPRGHLARQPRGDARDGRLVEVRREEHRLLRLSRAAVVLDRAQAGRLHDHEPREQPRLRLRRLGAGGDDRRAQARRPALHGTAGRDRSRAQGRDEGRVRRLRAVSLGAGPARHRGRREPRAEGRPEGRRRRRDDARRRRGERPPTRASRAGDVPRRAARQRRRVLARGRPGRRRPRRRPRAARPPRHRVVPRARDRLQPRQLPRQRDAQRVAASRARRRCCERRCAATAPGSRASSCPCS